MLPRKSFCQYPKFNAMAARLAMFLWLLGWFLKCSFAFPYLLQTTIAYPVSNRFFPSFFVDPYVAVVFYLFPLLVIPVVILNWQKWFLSAASLMVTCAAILNLHINTCNDATFVTSFWTAVWLCWFIRHLFQTTDLFKLQAKVLAQCVVAMMFLGGAIGKLTPEYWTGEVFRQIFLEQGISSPIGKILSGISPDVQRLVLLCFSKVIIGVEFLLALAPFLPYRFVICVLLAASFGIAMFSTWRIFSVLLCLLGILVACLIFDREES